MAHRNTDRSVVLAQLPTLDETTTSLTLTLTAGELGLRVGRCVRVSVVRTRGRKVSLRIEAPSALPIEREGAMLSDSQSATR
jgi:hypothetical protein